jgi:hypothetical protein
LNKRRTLLAVGISLAILISVACLPLFPVLELRQSNDDKRLLALPIQVGETFMIRYTHSIHLTPVLESYYIDKNLNIVVDSVTYDSYGIGMPSDIEPGQTFTQVDGKFVIGNINRRLPFFEQRVGQVIANHVLIAGGREIPLRTVITPGSSIRFQAGKESWIQRYGRGILD